MRKSSLTVASSLLAVFISGAVVGAFGHRLYTVRSVNAGAPVNPPAAGAKPSPEEFRRKYTEELRSRLNLDEPQLAKLNTILDQTRERFHQMRERSKEAAKEIVKVESGKIRQNQRNEIRAMLKAEQQPEYEKILQERENREKERQQKANQKP
jgi:periplasmic protein CpxP/Spy